MQVQDDARCSGRIAVFHRDAGHPNVRARGSRGCACRTSDGDGERSKSLEKVALAALRKLRLLLPKDEVPPKNLGQNEMVPGWCPRSHPKT
jgi:hypothetical protein